MHKITDAPYKLPAVPIKKLNPKHISLTTSKNWYTIPKDVPRHDIYLDHLMIKNQLQRTANKLKENRKKFERQKKNLDKQWSQLRENEEKFRETIIAHNDFLTGNMEKRSRAAAKCKEHQKSIQVRQNNINKICVDIEKLKEVLNLLRKEVSKHEIYENFLTRSLEHGEFRFKTIHALISRYVLLQSVREHLLLMHVEENEGIATYHRILIDTLQETHFITVGLRNDVDAACFKYEELFNRNLTTESLINSIDVRANERFAEVTTAWHMIDFIYRYICHRRKTAMEELGLRNIQPKIDIIKGTLQAWEKISGTMVQKTKASKPKRRSKGPSLTVPP